MFLGHEFGEVDHLAIAVRDLNKGIAYYTTQLSFQLETIRETNGKHSGMRSAVLWSGDFSVVLLEAIDENSQIQKYLDKYGPGVQHVAFKVRQIEVVRERMEAKGVAFSTSIIVGDGLKQMFTRRDENTGVMYEFIERTNERSFQENNIDSLFAQLESQDEC